MSNIIGSYVQGRTDSQNQTPEAAFRQQIVQYFGRIKTLLTNNYDIRQLHGRQIHHHTQVEIEHFHCSMKIVVKQNNYYSPSELVYDYDWEKHNNNCRYHGSLNNLKHEDVYFGRDEEILAASGIMLFL